MSRVNYYHCANVPVVNTYIFEGRCTLNGNEAISLFEKFSRRLTGDISASCVAKFAGVRDTSVSQYYTPSRDRWKYSCHWANTSVQTNNHLTNFLFTYQYICQNNLLTT
jgi:hypothetical protein